MAEKLILNANLICKADRFVPKKCAVEKVIEVPDSEFRTFIENPMKHNYHLPAYKDLMGYYDDTYHGVLFVNMENGDCEIWKLYRTNTQKQTDYAGNCKVL